MIDARRLLLGLLLVAAAGCGESYPPTSEGLYMAKCSRCHHADGSSLTASEQADRRIDLRTEFFQSNVADSTLRRIMQFGEGRMQGIPGLSEAEMDSIVLHVRRLGPPDSSVLDTTAIGG
jgi:cytochrome c553